MYDHIWLIRVEFITFIIKQWTSSPDLAWQTKSLHIVVLDDIKITGWCSLAAQQVLLRALKRV